MSERERERESERASTREKNETKSERYRETIMRDKDQRHGLFLLQCVAVRCSVLQSVAVCCSELQCVAVSCSVLQCEAERQHKKDQAWPRQKTQTLVVAVFYRVLQCVAVQCSVLHCETERQHTRDQAWPRPKTRMIGYGDQRLPSPQQTNCLAPLLLPLLHVEYFKTQIKKNYKTCIHSLNVSCLTYE